MGAVVVVCGWRTSTPPPACEAADDNDGEGLVVMGKGGDVYDD